MLKINQTFETKHKIDIRRIISYNDDMNLATASYYIHIYEADN